MRTVQVLVSLFCVLALRAGAGMVLCIGLNHYAGYPTLMHAENDAVEMGRAFARLGHEVRTLTGSDVTRANVLQALAAQPELVYFAGHATPGFLQLGDGKIAVGDIASARSLLVLDCCYIGLALNASGTMKVFAASQYEAFESGRHGIFTKYLLQWLGEGKCMSSEVLLKAYLEKSIRAETGGWQKPVMGFI